MQRMNKGLAWLSVARRRVSDHWNCALTLGGCFLLDTRTPPNMVRLAMAFSALMSRKLWAQGTIYLFIYYWLIAQPTTQGHLGAFHKFKSRTSRILYTIKKNMHIT